MTGKLLLFLYKDYAISFKQHVQRLAIQLGQKKWHL